MRWSNLADLRKSDFRLIENVKRIKLREEFSNLTCSHSMCRPLFLLWSLQYITGFLPLRMLAAVFTAGVSLAAAAGLLSSFFGSSFTAPAASAFTTGGEVTVAVAQGGGV